MTTCSDWQLPLTLAPLREQLEVLGAVAPVPVILEVGSTVSLRLQGNGGKLEKSMGTWGIQQGSVLICLIFLGIELF